MKNWPDLVSNQIPLQRRFLPTPTHMRDGDLLDGGFAGSHLLAKCRVDSVKVTDGLERSRDWNRGNPTGRPFRIPFLEDR